MARRRAKRRRMPTEMKAKAFSKMIEDDLTDEIEVQLNSFVRSVISDLTSDGQKRGVSPVLTGFFASSWKAGLTRPSHNEPIQGKWAKLKKVTVIKLIERVGLTNSSATNSLRSITSGVLFVSSHTTRKSVTPRRA